MYIDRKAKKLDVKRYLCWIRDEEKSGLERIDYKRRWSF